LKTREAAAELKRQQGTQHLAKAGQRERLTTLKAPVAGTVQQLTMHTEGGVVTEAKPLMVIVPDGAQVTAEVTLDNKDMSVASPTQEPAIKLETFPYTSYETVSATVKTVMADAVNDQKRGAIFPGLASTTGPSMWMARRSSYPQGSTSRRISRRASGGLLNSCLAPCRQRQAKV
jgi:hemolysin D